LLDLGVDPTGVSAVFFFRITDLPLSGGFPRLAAASASAGPGGREAEGPEEEEEAEEEAGCDAVPKAPSKYQSHVFHLVPQGSWVSGISEGEISDLHIEMF
jgi:hypothetical protein